MADILNFKINDRSNGRTCKSQYNRKWKLRRNSFISKGKYDNRQNCKGREISNGQTIPKFANFWNFDSFPNWKNSEILKNFQVLKLWKFVNFSISQIPKIFNMEN